MGCPYFKTYHENKEYSEENSDCKVPEYTEYSEENSDCKVPEDTKINLEVQEILKDVIALIEDTIIQSEKNDDEWLDITKNETHNLP